MDDPVVLVRRRADRDADRALLVEAAAMALGVAGPGIARTPVVVTRTCARCGGTDHGQPSAPGVFLSLSRAGELVAVAASRDRPVGVDIEHLDRVARAGFDDVAFTAEERAEIAGSADPDDLRAVFWTSKEALLKLTGDGLRTDPGLLRVSGTRRLLAWPPSTPLLGAAVLIRLETPPGYAGTLAISG
jgi:4'-phosphopantetheinyl transferase